MWNGCRCLDDVLQLREGSLGMFTSSRILSGRQVYRFHWKVYLRITLNLPVRALESSLLIGSGRTGSPFHIWPALVLYRGVYGSTQLCKDCFVPHLSHSVLEMVSGIAFQKGNKANTQPPSAGRGRGDSEIVFFSRNGKRG